MVKPSKFMVLLVVTAQLSAPMAVADNRPKTTISGSPPSWVDAPGIWSKGKGKGDGSGEGGFGNGSGGGRGGGAGGSGSGSGSGAGGTNFTKPGSNSGLQKVGETEGSPGASGSNTTGGGSIRVHELWWPICAFVSENVGEGTGNAAIKGMIEMADACGVNVVVWPKTVKASSWNEADPNDVNSKQQKQCNIPPALAAKGSTTAMVMDPLTAARMCDSYIDVPDGAGGTKKVPDPAVAGCAELASGSSNKRDPNKPAPNHKHNVAGGGIAASIEVPSGHNAGTVAHEAQGHSQMGKPNGSTLGNGIGEPGEVESAETGGGGAWTGAGCAVMRATALPNDRRFGFDPQRTTYYVKPRDPQAYYDMTSDPPVFGAVTPVTLNAQNGTIVTPPGQTIKLIDDAKGQNPVNTGKPSDGKSQGTAMEDGEDSRHRRKNIVNALLESLKDGETDIADPTKGSPANPKGPPPDGPVKGNPRLGYDDNAAKGRAGGGDGGSAVTSADPPPSSDELSPGTTGGQEGADLVTPGAASASIGGGYGKGASLTYDESAPKGGLPLSDSFNVKNPSSRGPASEEATSADGLVRIVGGMRGPRSQLDDEEDFFEEVDEDGKPLKRKKRELKGRRESSRTAPRAPSAAGRASTGRKVPAGLR